jgi:hypothetical protein
MTRNSFFLVFLAIAFAANVASAQGPECTKGPHPSVLAVQQKCAKGSLFCKEAQVSPPPPSSSSSSVHAGRHRVFQHGRSPEDRESLVPFRFGPPPSSFSSRSCRLQLSPAVIPNLNRKETVFASILSASDGST